MRVLVYDDEQHHESLLALVLAAADLVDGGKSEEADPAVGLWPDITVHHNNYDGRPGDWHRPKHIYIPNLSVSSHRDSMGYSVRLESPQDDYIDLTNLNDGDAILGIANWIRNNLREVSYEDRARLEILVREFRLILESKEVQRQDPEDVAQITVAIETIDLQLKAPKPSRAVLRWTMSQIPGFMIGFLSNVGNDAFTHFTHLLSG